ncbi:MAG: hypothetical protein IKC10_06090 [Alphaproteobacteria bacterium]|nr:hypothetical protein [Alphaproteobacteria bacterium]
MYMWLVLSTFLAILAGYSLPMRSDTPEKVNVPVASAHMVKMVINHRVALKYARKLKWPYYCAGTAEGDTVTECDPDKRIGFTPGSIDPEELDDYIPNGFVRSEEYTSQIFCYNKDESHADECHDVTDNPKTRLLITYGDLHIRWLATQEIATAGGTEKTVVTPNDDVIKAFRNHFGYDEWVGYIRENGEEKEIINYQGTPVYTIPDDMWNEISANCNTNYNGSCIAYVSKL